MAKKSYLSSDSISSFIKYLEEKGLKTETIKSYERNLLCLLDSLPEAEKTSPGKELNTSILQWWVNCMVKKGVCTRTINHRISSCNSYFAFIGRHDLLITPLKLNDTSDTDALTRGEYIRLLTASRELGKEQLFYLLRTIASIGIRIADLNNLSVSFLKSENEYLVLSYDEKIRVPYTLKKELLEYTIRNNIISGPVFVTKRGLPVDRINTYRQLTRVCRFASVPIHKVTPTNLRILCFETYDETAAQFRHLIEKAYDGLLESEQLTVCWN